MMLRTLIGLLCAGGLVARAQMPKLARVEDAPATWMGAMVRNVVGTGLVGQTGVMVMEAPVGSAASRFGLRRDDVILSVNGGAVEGFAALTSLSGTPERVKISRGQAEVTLSLWQGFARSDSDFGGRVLTIVAPAKTAEGKPWLWRGEFFGAFATVDEALLKVGWHVVYLACPNTFGSPETMERWEKLYEELTGQRGFSKRPVLLGMSRGGLYVYNWAAAHPDKVGLIYGDAPVCDVKSWPGGKGKGKGSPRDWDLFQKVYGFDERQAMAWRGNPIDILPPIAAARIPVIHVVGEADDVVPVDENTSVLKERYEALGGKMEVIGKPGVGHHPHSLEDPTPIVKFILENRLN